MRKRKRFFPGLCCVLLCLCLQVGVLSATAAETTAVETTSSSQTASEKDGGLSKPVKILGFLAIFTVACAGTAYLVMRPSLQKLKEAKQQGEKAKQEEK